jgi:hypothetical protein
LLHRRRGRGLHRPLRRDQHLTAELRRGIGALGRGQIGDVLDEIARALLHQTARALLLANRERLGRGVIDDGDDGFLGIFDRG